MAGLGLAAGTLGWIALWRNVTDLVASAAALNNAVLPLWMIVFGVGLLTVANARVQTRPEATLRRVASRRTPSERAGRNEPRAPFNSGCNVLVVVELPFQRPMPLNVVAYQEFRPGHVDRLSRIASFAIPVL